MKKLFNKELAIGLSVILALLILFFGIEYLKGVNVFKAANYYYVSYTNVTGLSVSAPVNASGYKVGLVREMAYEYDNPGHVIVEISLDKDLKIPEGTKAELTTDLLGTATITLHMPDNATAYCHPGDKLEGFMASGMLDNVSNELLPSINAVMPKVDSLLTAVTTLASDPALLAAIQRLDKITANLNKATQHLSASMRPLPSVMNNADSITSNIVTITSDIKGVTAQLNDMPLDSTMHNVHAATAALNEILADMQSDKSSLGLLLNNPDLYNNLNAAVGSLDSLLIDVKKNPKRYISIKLL